MTVLDHLAAAFQQWLTDNNLPQMSADELVVGDSFGITLAQRGWIEDFLSLWDAEQSRQS